MAYFPHGAACTGRGGGGGGRGGEGRGGTRGRVKLAVSLEN